MKKLMFFVVLTSFFSSNGQAAFAFTPQNNNHVGLYLGGQLMQNSASGSLGEKSGVADFNLNKEQQINYFIAFEHPFPLLPNARISSSTLDTSGKRTLTQEFNFGGKTFSTGDDLNARFNVSYVDYTFYYGLLSSRLFSFDIGLTARDFNGAVTIKAPTEEVEQTGSGWHESCYDENGDLKGDCSGATSSDTAFGKIKTNQFEPMLYIATNISLPKTNLSFFAHGDISMGDEHSLSDYQLGLTYAVVKGRMPNIYLTLGYRSVKMQFENLNDLYTDLAFKGTFVGVKAHF